MSRLHLRRPSPALAISLVALFAALGGGAFAATSDIKSDKKIAKKAAKAYFNGHIGGASVSHSNTAGSATNATTAATAANANALGGSPASAFERSSSIMSAVVTNNGTVAVVRGTAGVTATRSSTGFVHVAFPVDVSTCTWVATQGHPGNTGVGASYATVRGDGNPNHVGVVTRDNTNAQVDQDFHLVVVC